jgi:hypothetical protein
MIHLVDTSYRISGDELNRRNGATAMNAVFATLRTLGRDQLPVLDRDYQIFTMIHAALNGLDVGEIAQAPAGSLVAAEQAKKNPALDKLDAGMERALGLVDEIEAEPAPRGKKAVA